MAFFKKSRSIVTLGPTAYFYNRFPWSGSTATYLPPESPERSCVNWTSTDAEKIGNRGYVPFSSDRFFGGSSGGCSASLPLYCLEQ